MRLSRLREIDYQIAERVFGWPKLSDASKAIYERLRLEFSHGEKHRKNPCELCGRVPAPWDTECVPPFSSSKEAAWLVIHELDNDDLKDIKSPLEVCAAALAMVQ